MKTSMPASVWSLSCVQTGRSSLSATVGQSSGFAVCDALLGLLTMVAVLACGRPVDRHDLERCEQQRQRPTLVYAAVVPGPLLPRWAAGRVDAVVGRQEHL